MATKTDDNKLKFHEKPGKVTLVNGFRWIRYRVYFENGQDIGSLDRTQIATRKEWSDKA